MPKAYSYLRFSTPEQLAGDSFRRQTTLAHEYAAKHGLELDDKLTFQDLGVSAFRGKNADTGRLAEFLEAVRAGLVPEDSYLLVESLDRISRQAARKALRVLESICDENITVVTLMDGRSYTRDLLDSDPMALIMSLLIFIRANEESAHKSMRVKAAWEGKRSRATVKPLTSNGPAWLRLDKQTGEWRVIPECADVVRRIYRDYLAGHGAQVITQSLNREKVPAFIRETRKGPRQSKQWHRSYVRRMLENPAVIGTFTPHVTEFEDRTKKRRKAQDPIPNYFPPIVDADTFQRAQALQLDTPSPLRGKNAHVAEVKNLFGGLLRCGRCDGAMIYVSKGGSGGRSYSYVICRKARDGAGCKYTLVPYRRLEPVFLQNAPRLLALAPTGPEHTQLDAEIQQVGNTLDALGDRLSSLAEAYAQTRMGTLLTKMRALEAEKVEFEKKQEDLNQKAGILACPLVTKRLQGLEEALQADSLDRRKVNALMRMVFSAVTVNPDTCTVDVTWKNGIEGESLLYWWPGETAKAA